MNDPGWRRRVWVLSIVGLTLLALALRGWNGDRFGLEHFDEGIYALAGTWSVRPGGLGDLDPSVVPYAPAGLPILIGLSYRLNFPWPGVSATAAILPALICGVATIPILARLAARGFGDPAGVAAGALAATSGLHIAFSRLALTDAPFLLGWLLVMVAGVRFLERPGAWRAIVLGSAVGLAQSLKYNGWLAGIIVIAAALLSRPPIRAGRLWGFGLGAIGLAAATYFPWYSFVERHGGYLGLIRHHRSYLSGWSAWVSNWRMQLDQVTALSGRIGAWGLNGHHLAGVLAGSLALIATPRVEGSQVRGRPIWIRHVVLVLGLGGLLGLSGDVLWWIGLARAPSLMARREAAPRIVGVWWAILAVMTPLYHPYARLWLPLQAASWIIAGGWMAEWIGPAAQERAEDSVSRIADRPLRFIAAGLVLVGVALDRGRSEAARPLPGLLAASDSLTGVADQIAGLIAGSPMSGSPTLRIYARPSLLFSVLRRSDVAVVREPDEACLRRNLRPGEVGVLDAWMGGPSGATLRTSGPPPHTRAVWLPTAPPNLPTRLDRDPAEATRRGPSAPTDHGAGILVLLPDR